MDDAGAPERCDFVRTETQFRSSVSGQCRYCSGVTEREGRLQIDEIGDGHQRGVEFARR